MSLFSSIFLPKLEKELIALEPVIAQFALLQIKKITIEIMQWIETTGNDAAAAIPSPMLQQGE